ncbi:MAG: hypothetical protein WB765_06105 [Acidimicrobiales bacterium]
MHDRGPLCRHQLANPTTIAGISAKTWRAHALVAVANEWRLLLGAIMAATPSAASAVRNTQRKVPVEVLDLIDGLDAGFEANGGSTRSKNRARP